jgi:hypothetical protein
MTLVRRLWAIGFVAAIAACASAPTVASESETWDQAKVTELGNQLAVTGNDWWQALRDQPESDTLGSGDSQVYDSMLRESRVMQEQSAALAGHLEAGKGRADTLDMYKSLKEMADDTEVDEERTFLEAPAIATWKKFKGLMDQLAPYYGTRDVGP